MLESIDITVLGQTLPQIESRIDKYIKVINHLHLCDVSKSREYQKLYNGFYRMHKRTQEFYKIYFDYLEVNKNKDINFVDVLTYLNTTTGRFEPSFASKLLATIDPDSPVWDSVVLEKLSIVPPRNYQKDRMYATIKTYMTLLEWYGNYFKTQNAVEVLNLFNSIYPQFSQSITAIKKVELTLWSMAKR